MNVNQFHILVGIYLMFSLLQSDVFAADSSSNSNATHEDENLAYNGNLYDVFKKRLDNVFKELYNNVSESKLPESVEQSTADTRLYDELKKRLDMFNFELAANSIAKATAFHQGKLYDRTGREIDKTKTKENIQSATKTPQEDDFYADYKRKLDELTKSLSAQDLERLSVSLMVHETDTKPSTKLRSNVGNRASALKAAEKRRRAAQAYRYGGDTLNYNFDIGSSYPAVVTKTLEATTGVGMETPKGLLNTVAQQMNISSLDLAKQLTQVSNPYDAKIQVQDPKLAQTLRKFIENSIRVVDVHKPANSPSNSPGQTHERPSSEKKTSASSHPSARSVPPLMPTSIMDDSLAQVLAQCAPQPIDQGVPQPAPQVPSQPMNLLASVQEEAPVTNTPQPCLMVQPVLCNNNKKTEPTESFNTRISSILDKVLSKLENLQATKKDENTTMICNTQDVPCNVTGSWSAYMAGLNFDIKGGGKLDTRTLGAAEKNNKLLSINASEQVPPKEHHFVDPTWKYMGSALKETGGPFYIFTQSPQDNVMATFVGYCRNCGGLDTIYGSWSILRPSKDCHDITTAVENKRDIFHRYTMDAKRKERYKEMLYDKSKFKKPNDD